MTPPRWTLPLIGAGSAVVGLLPWLVHGMRLPLQNLWAGPVTEATSPLVLLPFSQYAVVQLAAVLVAGGAIAGLVSRLLPGRRTGFDRVLLLVGVLLVQVIAVVQTTAVVGGGLQRRTESSIYLALLVAGSVAAVLVGAGVLLLTAARHRAPVVVGVALVAVLMPSWLGGFVVAPVSVFSGPYWILSVPQWLAPIAVGVAVAWSGLRTPGRIAAAVFAAIALWVGPALITGLVNSVGTRVYARYPLEMLQAGVRVFTLALGTVEIVVPPLLVAAAVAAVGIGARAITTRRMTAAANRT